MPEQTLDILTLNTWGIATSSDKARRIAAIATYLAECTHDLVGLQEVWEMPDLKLLIEGAKSGGLTFHHHFASGVSGSGLVIFSRYPIIQVHFHRFRAASASRTFWEYLGGKGIGMARVETASGVIDVYNTHAVAQYRPDAADENKAHRAAQLYEMTEFIKTHTQENPAVMLGDFNMQPHHIGYRIMTKLVGAADTYRALHPDDAGVTFSPENPYNTGKRAEPIDYIFIRDGQTRSVTPVTSAIMLKSYEDIAYSDHYAIATTLDLRPATESSPQPSSEDIAEIIDEIRTTLKKGITDTQKSKHETTWRMRFGIVGGFIIAVMRVPFLGTVLRYPLIAIATGYAFLNFILSYFVTRAEINVLKAVLDEINVNYPQND